MVAALPAGLQAGGDTCGEGLGLGAQTDPERHMSMALQQLRGRCLYRLPGQPVPNGRSVSEQKYWRFSVSKGLMSCVALNKMGPLFQSIGGVPQ